MKIALRAAFPTFLFSITFVVLSLSQTHATTVIPPLIPPPSASLVWGNVVMLDGGTYIVPLNAPERTYFVPPPDDPDDDLLIFPFVDIYQIDETGSRTFLETIDRHQEDDPDDPDDGDALFAWPSAGEYELVVEAFNPPPVLNFEDTLRKWIARLLFADVAHAQSFAPIVYQTLHITIVDANATPDPVIIIPGILGSEQHNGEWVIDPILHTYDDLIATLDENGYTRSVDLFPFPYNWRKSNIETAMELKEKIDEVKGICGCDKVDLVAHSMGGLVARQYIQSDAYEHDVDQLIFLGTPHLGAPKAYLMWEGGEVNAGLRDRGMEALLKHEAKEQGYSSLFDYVRDEPIESVRELLPVYDYIFDDNQLRHYPLNYPENNFLETLNNSVGRLGTVDVRTYAFVGETSTNKTINGIKVVVNNQYLPMWEDGYPERFYENSGNPGLVLGQGDETVPIASASLVASNLSVVESEHIALPAETEGNVYKILTGKDPETLVQRFINIPNFRLLLVKMLSPADLLVVAPDGKKIGKDFNGQEINEILNAFYTGFNSDTEFITVLNPLDGEYKIYIQGIGSGQYTVEADFISDATTTVSSFTGNTAQGITSELNLDVQDSGIAPDALDVVVTYESTLADLQRIYELGWINVGIFKSLKAQLNAAKKAPPVVAKALLQNMLKQLKAYPNKLLNAQGYQILKSDIEWLITH
ncbi:hypothetical protein HY414_01090 [Candidatus Kaiserbacteria bacterium]|nr:hypothetical protein [Candidatus Kaiserbacteria bacterium]